METMSMLHTQPYNMSSNLLYDQMNEVIYDLNDHSKKDEYTLFENMASLSLICDDKKCKECNMHFSIITCSSCKKETCGIDKCTTLFPDVKGYISICKTCENEVLSKIKPYKNTDKEKEKQQLEYNRTLYNYKKAAHELKMFKETLNLIH